MEDEKKSAYSFCKLNNCSADVIIEDVPLHQKGLTESQYRETFSPLDKLMAEKNIHFATESALRGLLADLEKDPTYFSRNKVSFSELLTIFITKGYIQDGLHYRQDLTLKDCLLLKEILTYEIQQEDWHIHYHGTNHIEAFVQDIRSEFRAFLKGRESVPCLGLTEEYNWEEGIKTLEDLFFLMDRKTKEIKLSLKSQSLSKYNYCKGEINKRNKKLARIESHRFIYHPQYKICTNLSLFGGNGYPLEYSLAYFLQNIGDRTNYEIPGKTAPQSQSISLVLRSLLSLKKIGITNMDAYLLKYEALFKSIFPPHVPIKGGRLIVFSINPDIAGKVSYIGPHARAEYNVTSAQPLLGSPLIIEELRRNPEEFEKKYEDSPFEKDKTVMRCFSGNFSWRTKISQVPGQIFPDPNYCFDENNFKTKIFDLYFQSPQQREEYYFELKKLVLEQLNELIRK